MASVHRKLAENDFVTEFEAIGPAAMAKKYDMQVAGIYKRRAAMEIRLGRQIKAPDNGQHFKTRFADPHPEFLTFKLYDGTAMVGSDSHYRSGHVTTAHRAFVYFAKEFQPKLVVKNGDELDGAAISRHPPGGNEYVPSVQEEIEETQSRLAEIEKAAPNAKRFWPLGNHDNRWATRLATVAPEFAKVHGFNLADHFPYWRHSWALLVNDDLVIKHRWKGGKHATHNNAVESGRSMVTGHLHSLKVTPWTDYNGTRFGVDCGTMAEPFGPQFRYAEASPRNWRSGFAILTFHKGRMLWPEVVHVIGPGKVEFRGKIYDV